MGGESVVAECDVAALRQSFSSIEAASTHPARIATELAVSSSESEVVLRRQVTPAGTAVRTIEGNPALKVWLQTRGAATAERMGRKDGHSGPLADQPWSDRGARIKTRGTCLPRVQDLIE